MIGAPTYETRLFPPVAQVVEMAVQKRIVDKKVAVFGSYGWSKGAERHLGEMIEPLKWEMVDLFQFTGRPTQDDLKKGEAFGTAFAKTVRGA